MNPKNSEIIIYQTEDGKTRIDVRMENETVWLTQAQMAELFQTTKQNISLHINNLFKENELYKISVVKEYLTTAADGKNYQTAFYNLDVIIAVGYRVKSLRGTQFRHWATGVLREYLVKGFSMNDEVLKNMGGGVYWKELLERIRDIRASEKVMYRQVLDLYATSMDYEATMPETFEFFKIVQNKLHYAVSGKVSCKWHIILMPKKHRQKAICGTSGLLRNKERRAELLTSKKPTRQPIQIRKTSLCA
jgi:hypothetical protein